jgi:hypothetical protein
MGVFCPLLLCYHCSNAVVVTSQMTIVTVAYGLMLQCLFIVVKRTSLHGSDLHVENISLVSPSTLLVLNLLEN